MTESVLAGGLRTPFGDFRKSLRDVSAVRRGHQALDSLH